MCRAAQGPEHLFISTSLRWFDSSSDSLYWLYSLVRHNVPADELQGLIPLFSISSFGCALVSSSACSVRNMVEPSWKKLFRLLLWLQIAIGGTFGVALPEIKNESSLIE